MGVEMMGVMTTQQLLPLTPVGAVLIGDATALVTDGDGGRVFIRGELCFVWDAGDDLGRRLAAVQLVRIKAATAMAVAALMRTSWTAASRRPRSSPASHTKHSSPRMNTRPPSPSVTKAVASPIRTAPTGVRGRSCWVVITPIISTPIFS